MSSVWRGEIPCIKAPRLSFAQQPSLAQRNSNTIKQKTRSRRRGGRRRSSNSSTHTYTMRRIL
jgi:hypothetical protein